MLNNRSNYMHNDITNFKDSKKEVWFKYNPDGSFKCVRYKFKNNVEYIRKYDLQGKVKSAIFKDLYGNEYHYIYKSSHDCRISYIKYFDKSKEIYKYRSDGTMKSSTYTDINGNQSIYKYNKDRLITYIKNLNNYERWYKYDKNHRIIYYKDSNNHEFLCKYDENDTLIYSKNNIGIEKWYDSDQCLIAIKDNDSYKDIKYHNLYDNTITYSRAEKEMIAGNEIYKNFDVIASDNIHIYKSIKEKEIYQNH